MIVKDTDSTSLEEYFETYRKNIIGYNQPFETPYGSKKIIYADWTASGRLYNPIEEKITKEIGPFVGNTHTESTITGTLMTNAYQKSHSLIKKHVNALETDVIITEGSGMTGVINKFQRILGLRIPERVGSKFEIPSEEKPVVFVSHMEHHSNHTSWLETIADVECLMPNEAGLIDLDYLKDILKKYESRKLKIASITACSNVTGIRTCYEDVAVVMHQNGGLCFVDFACSAPYVTIDMHPQNPLAKLDAIYFSPHKFLGGPGASGVLIFDASLYSNAIPDEPGGGTVAWTNPWGGRKYLEDIEFREDGGTPAFLQTIKAAMAIQLKEEMGVGKMLKREEELVELLLEELGCIDGLHLLAEEHKNRLGVISFHIDNLHYDLATKILNDKFGIQTRSGCSCAGTYGHYLFHISKEESQQITHEIDQGNYLEKPGWIRLSIHPVMTNKEIDLIIEAIRQLVKNHQQWESDYTYEVRSNTFSHNRPHRFAEKKVEEWFDSLI
jgi:selenocysteine lyase/cysteine desulfurase